MKQTAVEWLVNELKGIYESDYLNKLVEQAKEKEKEQKCKFADDYADKVMSGMLKRASEYYEETFKSE